MGLSVWVEERWGLSLTVWGLFVRKSFFQEQLYGEVSEKVADQNVRHDGIKCCAIVNEEHPDIALQVFQVFQVVHHNSES